MLQDKVNKTAKIILLAILVIAVVCIAPAIAVWTINSIAESGGSKFYLEHNLWNYFLIFLFFAMVRGGKS